MGSKVRKKKGSYLCKIRESGSPYVIATCAWLVDEETQGPSYFFSCYEPELCTNFPFQATPSERGYVKFLYGYIRSWFVVTCGQVVACKIQKNFKM